MAAGKSKIKDLASGKSLLFFLCCPKEEGDRAREHKWREKERDREKMMEFTA